MVDANQSLATAEALRRGRAFEALGCAWWEEPIPADDIEGYAALVSGSTIPIATGENLYTYADFARFLRRDAVDIVQPDLRRAGGPTALLQIGTLAHAFRRPYASHGGGPVQLNIMACLPNAMYLETGLIKPGSPLKLKDGYVDVPTGPGFAWE
jgi:L-alanine-DL-glutamate epimerase-like enolase superfamily enzyme